MGKILSKEEVDALLSTPGAAERVTRTEDRDNSGLAATGKIFKVYNFRRPDRVPKATLQSLQLLHDRFCVSVAAGLSAYLRTVTEVSILSVDQINFGEFLATLPDAKYLCPITMRPLNGLAALEIGLELVLPLIDRILGGAGRPPGAGPQITEIDRNVIQGVVNVITTSLTETWRPTIEVNFSYQPSEARPQFKQIASPNEVMLALGFEMKVGETRGAMHICIPYSTVEVVGAKFEQDSRIQQNAVSSSDSMRVLQCMLRAPFEMTGELPPTMVSVRDLLSVAKGDVIRLDTRVEDPIRLHIGGMPTFQVEAIEMGGHKAVKVMRTIED